MGMAGACGSVGTADVPAGVGLRRHSRRAPGADRGGLLGLAAGRLLPWQVTAPALGVAGLALRC